MLLIYYWWQLCFYQLYKMVKGTFAVNVFIGLALIYIVWIIVGLLN